MITVFKIFENLDIPKVGDFVLCSDNTSSDLDDFFKSNIGKIEKIMNVYIKGIKDGECGLIKFDYVPSKFTKFFTNHTFSDGFYFESDHFEILKNMKDITDFAKTKEELELKIKAKKYNVLWSQFKIGEDNKCSCDFNSEHIVTFSKTKKELKQIIKAKKYNIL